MANPKGKPWTPEMKAKGAATRARNARRKAVPKKSHARADLYIYLKHAAMSIFRGIAEGEIKKPRKRDALVLLAYCELEEDDG